MHREILGVAVPSEGRIYQTLHKRLGYPSPAHAPDDIRGHVLAAVPLARMAAKPVGVVAATPFKDAGQGVIYAEHLLIRSSRWAALAQQSLIPTQIQGFALTLGKHPDRVAALLQNRSLAFGYVFDAACSEIIEQVAGRLAAHLAKEPESRRLCWTRCFSPGYCDWPHQDQLALLEWLAPEDIGVRSTTAHSLLPAKTLTAVMLGAKGLSRPTPCALCPEKKCPHRREKAQKGVLEAAQSQSAPVEDLFFGRSEREGG